MVFVLPICNHLYFVSSWYNFYNVLISVSFIFHLILKFWSTKLIETEKRFILLSKYLRYAFPRDRLTRFFEIWRFVKYFLWGHRYYLLTKTLLKFINLPLKKCSTAGNNFKNFYFSNTIQLFLDNYTILFTLPSDAISRRNSMVVNLSDLLLYFTFQWQKKNLR